MARVLIDFDRETFNRLLDVAHSERRSVPMQAEVIVRQALGLPFPYPVPTQPPPPCGRNVPRKNGARRAARGERDRGLVEATR